MKGATHNLVVRTRTDVALYVLNHKRGHLRDLENSFKVTLAVIADPTVSGQQSFVIDRGEQVHTLEAAKALLVAQAAAAPAAVEEAFDDEELLDAEAESEVETEETEGLSDEARRRRSRFGSRRATVRGEAAAAAAWPRRRAARKRRAARGECFRPGGVRSGRCGGRRRKRSRGRRSRRTAEPGAVPIKDQASGGRVAAGAVADAAGAADPKKVLPDRSPMSSDPFPRRRPRARLPISTRCLRNRRLPRPNATEHASRGATGDGPSHRRAVGRGNRSASAGGREGCAAALDRAREGQLRGQLAGRNNGARSSQPAEPAEAPAETPAEPGTETATETEQPRRAGWWSRRFGGGE